jgi:AhpD family alkylhydroperoxidase
MSKRLDYTQIAPAGIKALGGVYGYVAQSSLPPVLVDLVYLRISQINNCAYCLDMHTRDLLKKGQKIEKLALVQAWAEAGHLFDERERAAVPAQISKSVKPRPPDKATPAETAPRFFYRFNFLTIRGLRRWTAHSPTPRLINNDAAVRCSAREEL